MYNFKIVTNAELAILWNLFENLQSRSNDKYGLDKDIFFTFVNVTVRVTPLQLFNIGIVGASSLSVILGDYLSAFINR